MYWWEQLSWECGNSLANHVPVIGCHAEEGCEFSGLEGIVWEAIEL